MDTELQAKEHKIDMLTAENELADRELSLTEKRILIKRMKEEYGTNWRKVIGGAIRGLGKLRVNSEAMQTLHSQGIGIRRYR